MRRRPTGGRVAIMESEFLACRSQESPKEAGHDCLTQLKLHKLHTPCLTMSWIALNDRTRVDKGARGPHMMQGGFRAPTAVFGPLGRRLTGIVPTRPQQLGWLRWEEVGFLLVAFRRVLKRQRVAA